MGILMPYLVIATIVLFIIMTVLLCDHFKTRTDYNVKPNTIYNVKPNADRDVTINSTSNPELDKKIKNSGLSINPTADKVKRDVKLIIEEFKRAYKGNDAKE